MHVFRVFCDQSWACCLTVVCYNLLRLLLYAHSCCIIVLQLLTHSGGGIPQGVNLTAPISPSNLALLTGARLPLRVAASSSSTPSSRISAAYIDDNINYELMAPILASAASAAGNSNEAPGAGNPLIDEDPRYFQCEPMETAEESPIALTREDGGGGNSKK